MKKYSLRPKIRYRNLSKVNYWLFRFTKKDKHFFTILLVLTLVGGSVLTNAFLSMWFGFILSSYAVIANDSIQTIGIFITSNARKIKWFYLWFFL